MSENSVQRVAAKKLDRAGVGRLITVLVSSLVVAAIFFGAAGTLAVPRAWIYYGGLIGYLLVVVVAMALFAPGVAEVVNARGRPFKKDVKTWDKVVGLAMAMLMFLAPAVAGLDVGRWHGPSVPFLLAVPSLVVTLLAYAFVNWAMVVNRHAETGVRIQNDREHQVVSSGPYRFVRHPFYISLIVVNLVYPLAVGSLWAYVPSFAMAAIYAWRTAREDATLQAELKGYVEYAARVRFRLVPGVW